MPAFCPSLAPSQSSGTQRQRSTDSQHTVPQQSQKRNRDTQPDAAVLVAEDRSHSRNKRKTVAASASPARTSTAQNSRPTVVREAARTNERARKRKRSEPPSTVDTPAGKHSSADNENAQRLRIATVALEAERKAVADTDSKMATINEQLLAASAETRPRLMRKKLRSTKKLAKFQKALHVAEQEEEEAQTEADPTSRAAHRALVKKSLISNRYKLYALLKDDITNCRPRADHIVAHFRVFDLTSIPVLDGPQAMWFEKAKPHLVAIFHHFQHKNAMRMTKDPLTNQVSVNPEKNLSLWPDDATENMFIVEARQMLPRMAALGAQVYREMLLGGERVMTPEQITVHVVQGGERRTGLGVWFTMADAFEGLPIECRESHPLMCAAIRFMLVYSDNSCGPERQFSLMNRLKTQGRASLSHQMLEAEMHINANPLGFCDIDVPEALEKWSATRLTHEP